MLRHMFMRQLLHIFLVSTLFNVLLFTCNSSAEEVGDSVSMLDNLEWKLELGRHDQLLIQKQNPENSLAEFTTDGCSGGLSVGWKHLADSIDQIRKTHGDLPPWESCCIDHDKQYHTAGSADLTGAMSFLARKQADEELRTCVIETGIQRAPELSVEYELSLEDVSQIYQAIGDLMYRAVRIGGVPCTGLPWRWGYGWPQCD